MDTSYIPLAQYKKRWIFNHKDLPVSDEDKTGILPLDEKSSMLVWKRWISNRSSHYEQFSKGDWAAKEKNWVETDNWQSAWDSNEAELPELWANHFNWSDDTPIYFCYEKYQVIETCWGIFKRNWKCFLFFDDGPLLVSPTEKQAVIIYPDGQYKLGVRG